MTYRDDRPRPLRSEKRYAIDVSERLRMAVEAAETRDRWIAVSQASLKEGDRVKAREALESAELWHARHEYLTGA